MSFRTCHTRCMTTPLTTETKQLTGLEQYIASELRAMLARHNITQAEFAAAVGMSLATTSRILRGQRSLTVGQLERAAHFFGSTPPSVILNAYKSAPARQWREESTTPVLTRNGRPADLWDGSTEVAAR